MFHVSVVRGFSQRCGQIDIARQRYHALQSLYRDEPAAVPAAGSVR